MEKILSDAPEGNLKIDRRGSRFYYSVRESAQKRSYISYFNQDVSAAQLQIFANKRLARDTLKILRRNLRAADSFLKYHSGKDALDIAEEFPPELQFVNANLIQTNLVIETNWANASYASNPFRPEDLIVKTKKGCFVRSKSEMIISDLLFDRGILYRNECLLDLRDGKPPIYPDFTILHPKSKKTIYWEHFGRMDDKEYCNDACSKINRYVHAGIVPGESLFLSFETEKTPLDAAAADAQIEALLI